MKNVEKYVVKVSRFFDSIAGLGIIATMLLVVVNILLSTILNSPIQGVYEYVSYLTAGVIGFAIAHCAVQNGHIAIEFLVEKMPVKIQKTIDTLFRTMLLLFLLFATIQLVNYALKVALSGEVSPTAHMPFYPFILMVAVGLFVLCLVEMVKVLKGVMGK